MKRFAVIFIVLLCLTAGAVAAQDVIKDSTEYKEMMRYKDLYDQAYKEGDYEKALEYAREVKKWSEAVKVLADAELERRRNATTVVVNPGDNYDQIKENLTREMAERRERLQGLNADRIAPDEYAALNERIDRFLELLEDPDRLAEAQTMYNEIIAEANILEQLVRDKTEKVRSLMVDSREAIDRALAGDAAVVAPDLIASADGSWNNGESLYNEFYYDDAIAAFEKALYEARGAELLAERTKAIADTDTRMTVSKETLEGSSRVMVKDEKGRVTLSDGWSGQAYLDEVGLTDLTPALVPWEEGMTEPELMPVAVDTLSDPEAKDPETSLETAIRFWIMGVNARNAGNLEKANDYFSQTVVMAEAWRSASPEVIYTVRKMDCLWNIAKKLYGNPFLWPLIFKANQDKIENPSLIFPGQEFLIPNP